ncbi:TPT-domain-containing protein [Aureobasidium subglaciale]|nr:TPT-domain-containing protein [Aureobasidium subglaciale]
MTSSLPPKDLDPASPRLSSQTPSLDLRSPASFAESFELEETSPNTGLLSQMDDAEKALPANSVEASSSSKVDGHEYTISTKTKMACLGLYFFMNLGLTLYNKAVLNNFNFPWLVTTFHTSSAALGCWCIMLLAPSQLKLSHVGSREQLVLAAFSVLFTVNIAISNVSLAMVSVPFHQIVRSTTPVATVLIYRYLGRSYGTMTYISLIPIIAGVGLSTYGDYYATLLGASLTFLGVFLAALKTVATNKLLTGSLKLPALELLFRMCPLAAIQSLLWATATGEVSRFLTFTAEGKLTPGLIFALLGNGFLAFLLNVTSFQTNKLAGALTLSVCGNVKQVLTVVLGIVLWDLVVRPMNALGMVIALGGAAWYSKVELDSKRATARS